MSHAEGVSPSHRVCAGVGRGTGGGGAAGARAVAPPIDTGQRPPVRDRGALPAHANLTHIRKPC